MKFRIMIGIISLAIIIATGCSKDKPTSSTLPDTTPPFKTAWDSTGGYWVTTNLNASSTSDFIFYSFAVKDTITLTMQEALSNTIWSLGFKRVYPIINSGQSGAGNVTGVDLAAIGNPDSTNFEGFTNLASIDSSAWQQGSLDMAINEWYSYNPGTHTLAPTRNVYILTDATNNFVKFNVISLVNPSMPPNMGTVSIQYIYSGALRNFSGAPDTLTFDGSGGGPVYIDFSSGTVVNPANPLSSTEWDILFENYEVHQNNTIFGSGATGTYEVWQGQTDPTNFDETASVAQGVPFFPDNYGSPLTDWYIYDYLHHTPPSSNNHVFIIRQDGHTYKIQILSYVAYIGGARTLGYYTFRWLALN